MKESVKYLAILIPVSLLVLLLTGCPSPVSGDLSAEAASEVTIAVDSARGVAVLTEADGSETVISSEEDGTMVGCESVTDYVIFDEDDTGRSASGSSGPRAIILGVRPDGRPGVWIVYPGGLVVVPEGDGSDPTSELLEVVSEADGFHWDAGWDYTALSLSDDGAIIVGTAENPDATWLADYIGGTPKVVVWWNLYESSSGYYVLSHARVVAEYPQWDFEEVRNGHRHHHRYHYYYRWLRWLFDRLGLWFFAWADDYLGDVATDDDLGDAALIDVVGDGTYGIYGYDSEGDFARALIDRYRVLSIDKTDPPGGSGDDNLPPWPVTGPTSPAFLYPGSGEMTVDLVITNTDTGDPVTDSGEFDPNGDKVTFVATLVENNSPVEPEIIIGSDGVMRITDDENLSGLVKYTVTASDDEFTIPYGSDQPISLYFF